MKVEYAARASIALTGMQSWPHAAPFTHIPCASTQRIQTRVTSDASSLLTSSSSPKQKSTCAALTYMPM